MNWNLNEIITDHDIQYDDYIERDGYIFTSLTRPTNVYDTIIIRNPIHADVYSPQYAKSTRSLEDHIALINKYQLEKAIVIAESLDFIVQCPSLKYLSIMPAIEQDGFDFSPLYAMPEIVRLSCQTCYGERENWHSQINYQNINGLIDLDVVGKGHINYNKIDTLKSLFLSQLKTGDLTNAFCSKKIDTLYIITCSIKSLDGIGQSKNMTCLYLYYNRSLRDISALKEVKSTLKTLRIENCSKIEDFSVLQELENLELLEITGSNVLPDLNFLNKMTNLKTFIFNVNVLDGDLTPCLRLNYVYCDRSRRHYNLKDKDLPKGQYIRGNEGIELWRRLE